MNATLPNPVAGTDCPAWSALASMAVALRERTSQSLFTDDVDRFAHCSTEAVGLLFDYSRQRVDGAVLCKFGELADQMQLRARTAAMFDGVAINTTEQRAVLHTALRRADGQQPVLVAGVDVMPEVLRERARVLDFAEGVRSGAIRGSTGLSYELVVNIGIGGSDLGPAMVTEALREFTGGAPRLAFVANVDGCQLSDALVDADPARTLFIICSKTFTTQETRANALAARDWLRERLGEAAVPAHFAAVSVNARAMDEFGVHPDYRFAMWDWVGGRYSVWSSIGVSVAIAIGAANFQAFLAGARAMDEHFQTARWAQNLPLLAGMLAVWNRDLLQLPTLAVLPYDQRLARLPAYLQQLEMESNGKSVRLDGNAMALATAPVVWGEPGSMAQHSFFQLLHQGTPSAALDFLFPVRSSCGRPAQQELAIANCLAQAEALAFGQSAERVAAELRAAGVADERVAQLLPHKVHVGSRPSTLIAFQQLDPHTLGTLLALYEHKVFVQSVIWGINAFDQWGVELGKKLCEGIVPWVHDPAAALAGKVAGSSAISASLRGVLGWLAVAGKGA